ncbi:MAG: ATP-binding protein [Thermogutta sp.]
MSNESDLPPSRNSAARVWEKRVPFQVDVAGVIRLMGQSLYSRPDAAVRELIQNAHDGIMRRRTIDLRYLGRIDIRQYPAENILEFSDDGTGLTAEEVEKYLGTLGVGLSGLLKRDFQNTAGSVLNLIGEFGIGFFSAFLLAERVEVITRHYSSNEAVRWEAGPDSEICISAAERSEPGTTVRLLLKADQSLYATDEAALERAVREYAEFLPIPIYINDHSQRVNIGTACWLEPTPDPHALELELETFFGETPLDFVVVRTEKPVSLRGALYVTPQRTPGFTDAPTVTVTVRRMIISRRIHGLLPEWASFVRGVLELPECSPTASREDLVRDVTFYSVREQLDSFLLDHFEGLARKNPSRWQSLIAWHRYLLAGAALEEPRLRNLLRETYHFTTSRGEMTFPEIVAASRTSAIYSGEEDFVIWYNPSRYQESWINEVFADLAIPCVHTLRSFEETLLALMVSDLMNEGISVDLRVATPSSEDFAEMILGVQELAAAPQEWKHFFADLPVVVRVGEYHKDIPVLAFLSEQAELQRTFEGLKKQGTMPSGFQRLIEAHFQHDRPRPNEVILNRRHLLVKRALEQSTRVPLASVVRLLVIKALRMAGMPLDAKIREVEYADLVWIAEALWGRD